MSGLPATKAETVEQCRLRKRLASVTAITRTPEYATCVPILMVGLEPNAVFLLFGPDFADLAMSKREWEYSVMHWRRCLKELAARIELSVELLTAA